MSRVLFDIDRSKRQGARQCGSCSLCCKLLPVNQLKKPANTKCQHQKFGTGCAVYGKPWMPADCVLWSCRWLINPEETSGLSRPDRVHYVIDMMPDFARIVNNETGEELMKMEVIQIWCDPAHRDAHRDPALRAYLEEKAKDGIGALVRYSEKEAIYLMAPALTDDGKWHEGTGKSDGRSHTPGEVAEALGSKLQVHVTATRSALE